MAGFDHAQSARLGQRTLVEAPGVYIVEDLEHMPEAPYAGQQVWRRDLNQMYVWVVDTWEVVQDPIVSEVGPLLPGLGQIVPDGNVPLTSPTPNVINGIGMLFVKWDPIVNADPVLYDIHIAAASGFTISPATLIDSTPGLMSSLKVLPDGSPLAYGTVYFVKIIARDADGAAPPSAEDSGTPIQIQPVDIPPFSIGAGELADFAVTIRKFNTGSHNIY